MLRENSNALMRRVKSYKKRLMQEIPVEKYFVDQLSIKLELNAEPLPTLEDEMLKAARKKEAIKKSKELHKASQKTSSKSYNR